MSGIRCSAARYLGRKITSGAVEGNWGAGKSSPSFATGAMDSWPKLINTGLVSKGLHYKGGCRRWQGFGERGRNWRGLSMDRSSLSPIRCSPANDVAENWV